MQQTLPQGSQDVLWDPGSMRETLSKPSDIGAGHGSAGRKGKPYPECVKSSPNKCCLLRHGRGYLLSLRDAAVFGATALTSLLPVWTLSSGSRYIGL